VAPVLKVIPNVADGSRLDFFCLGDSDRFAASAVYHPKPSPDVEVWKPEEIIDPAFKRKILSTADVSYAISTEIHFYGSDKTTVRIIARIKPIGEEAEEFIVRTVSGTDGTVEFSRLLIRMAKP